MLSLTTSQKRSPLETHSHPKLELGSGGSWIDSERGQLELQLVQAAAGYMSSQMNEAAGGLRLFEIVLGVLDGLTATKSKE